MTEEQMKERKKMLCDLMDNDLYVPMKIKELAILLDIPKEKRSDLQEVLDQLMLEGKVEVSQKGKYSKGRRIYCTCQGFWLRDGGRHG